MHKTPLEQKREAYDAWYRELEAQAKKFFSAPGWNDIAGWYRSVQFSPPDAGLAAGNLRVQGADFSITFRFAVIDNTPWGVLDLNFPATRFREAKSVGRWFFDEMGNVTTQPVGGEISGSVNDHRLLLRIMDRAEDEAIRATLGDGPK